MIRLLVAFAVAPLAPLIFLTPVVVFLDKPLDAIGPFAFVSIAYGYPALLLFGVPLFFLFRKKQWFEGWQVILGGTTIGALVPLVLMTALAFDTPGGLSVGFLGSILGMTLFGAFLGALSGLAFWVVGMYRFGDNP